MKQSWGNVWTDERTDRLRALLADGMSAQEIADDMGCSRNAVIGKVHRLGQSFVRAEKARAEQLLPQPPEARNRKRRRAPRARIARVVAAEGIIYMKPPPELPVTEGPVTIYELQPYHCKAVLREATRGTLPVYCGEHRLRDRGGQFVSPYCAGHHRSFHNNATNAVVRPFHPAR
jgi:GcrA cell cycle regulator